MDKELLTQLEKMIIVKEQYPISTRIREKKKSRIGELEN